MQRRFRHERQRFVLLKAAPAAALLLASGLARADEPASPSGLTITTPSGTVGITGDGTGVMGGPTNLGAPMAQMGPMGPTVNFQIGGAQVTPGVMRTVSVSSDAEGTRLLSVDPTMGMFYTGDGMMGPHQQICTAPCTVKLSTTSIYMIRGYGIGDSPHFGIGEQTRELHVHTGSGVVRGLGLAASTIGALALVGGAVILPIAYLDSPAQPTFGRQASNSSQATWEAVGWGSAIGGAALLGVGIVMALTSVTHVYDEGGARLGKLTRPRLTLSGLVF